VSDIRLVAAVFELPTTQPAGCANCAVKAPLYRLMPGASALNFHCAARLAFLQRIAGAITLNVEPLQQNPLLNRGSL